MTLMMPEKTIYKQQRPVVAFICVSNSLQLLRQREDFETSLIVRQYQWRLTALARIGRYPAAG